MPPLWASSIKPLTRRTLTLGIALVLSHTLALWSTENPSLALTNQMTGFAPSLQTRPSLANSMKKDISKRALWVSPKMMQHGLQISCPTIASRLTFYSEAAEMVGCPRISMTSVTTRVPQLCSTSLKKQAGWQLASAPWAGKACPLNTLWITKACSSPLIKGNMQMPLRILSICLQLETQGLTRGQASAILVLLEILCITMENADADTPLDMRCPLKKMARLALWAV